MNLKHKKSGFSLIELLLVVGFISLVSLGVYGTYDKVKDTNDANAEAINIQTIQAGVKSLYGFNADYTTLNNSIVNDARITPDTMRNSPFVIGDNTINHKYGNNVLVLPASFNGGTNNGFQIVYNGVPARICSKLITNLARQFDSINIGGTIEVKPFGSSNINIPLLTTSCNVGIGGITVSFRSH